jgi:signal transduction histidine kinase
MEKDYEQGLVRELHARERSLDERERFVRAREATLAMREAWAKDRSMADGQLMSQIQAANEKLVIASVHADERADSALARVQASETFVAMLSHELRNPMAPIVTALDIMDLSRTTAFGHERELIRRHVTHLIALIDELLDVARIAADKIVLRHEPCSLAAIVDAAVELSRSALTEKHHELVIRMPDSPVIVDGDRARLVQIAANLIGNAANYTPDHGTITITCEPRDTWAVLTVRDTGIGISPEMLPAIFEHFTQAGHASHRPGGGLGLGLAIVHSLVELHDGRVSASSPGLGLGSEFTVELPAGRQSRRRPAMATGERAAIVSRRVLVVDDNEDTLTLMQLALERLGHEVVVAADGPTALAAISSFRPEVAVLDLNLPGIDGYELARRLRALPDGPELRLVALSGHGQPEDRIRSRQANFDIHLVKPVEISELQAAITKQPP